MTHTQSHDECSKNNLSEDFHFINAPQVLHIMNIFGVDVGLETNYLMKQWGTGCGTNLQINCHERQQSAKFKTAFTCDEYINREEK